MQRNYGCRITEFTIAGMRAVTLENAALRVSVLADKGADIYELLYKPRDVDLLWRSPNGIVNPAADQVSIASGEGSFMDAYEGGWQELFPTLGPPSAYCGAELGAHGEVAMLPWSYRIERDEPDEVRVSFSVRMRRTPFHLTRSLILRGSEPVLFVEEEARNESEEMLPFMWGHHPVVGSPFLQPGCRLWVPGGTVHTVEIVEGRFAPTGTETAWPQYEAADGHVEDLGVLPEPDAAHVDELYISDLPSGRCAVANPALGIGFALMWDAHVFPYLWLWRTLGPASGYPWYGRTYSLGMEPFSSVPPNFTDALEAGTVLRLRPGERLSTWLRARAFEGSDHPDL